MNAFTATLPARKSSKNSKIEFRPALDNALSRVAGVLTIETDRASGGFVVEEAPDDMPGVRFFVLTKLDAGSDETEGFYCVRTRPEFIGVLESATACTCKGFHYKLTCKHVDAVNELVKAGKL